MTDTPNPAPDTLREELAKVLALHPEFPDWTGADLVLASGIIQRAVDEAVAGAYLAAAQAMCELCKKKLSVYTEYCCEEHKEWVHPEVTERGYTGRPPLCKAKLIRHLENTDARAAFEEAVRRESDNLRYENTSLINGIGDLENEIARYRADGSSALLAELEAKVDEWRKEQTTYGGIAINDPEVASAISESERCTNELSTIIAKHKPQLVAPEENKL